MGLFVLGINHKECPVEIREKLHFSPEKIYPVLNQVKMHPRISECVILSTCNRVELYAATPLSLSLEEDLLALMENAHGIKAETFLPYVYRFADKAAIRHLFRVASGLDSLVIGENEILGQVREAFRLANETGSVNAMLYRLFEKSLKVGKDVRTRTKINQGAVSIPSVAVELAEKIYGRLDGEKVMVLGTGEMSTLTMKNLIDAGAEIVYVVSRQREKGEKVGLEFGAEWLAMDSWEEKLPLVDILIGSTAAPHPVVTYDCVKNAMAKRRHRPLFIIDIAVPRDVESQVNSLDDVYVYNVDDLKGVASSNLKIRRAEITEAEELTDKAVEDYRAWMEQLKSRPTLNDFERFLDCVLDDEFSRGLKDTGADEKKIQAVKHRIRSRLLNPTYEKIKEASHNGGVMRYLEALRSLFNLDKKD